MVGSIDQIDLSSTDVMKTALMMGRAFFGAVRYADIREMPIDEYLEMIDEVNRQTKEEGNAT